MKFLNKVANFLRSLLSSDGGISSKRFWGSVIMIMLCWAYIYSTINQIEMPKYTGEFLTLAGVLLGLETVFKPFQKTNEESNE